MYLQVFFFSSCIVFCSDEHQFFSYNKLNHIPTFNLISSFNNMKKSEQFDFLFNIKKNGKLQELLFSNVRFLSKFTTYFLYQVDSYQTDFEIHLLVDCKSIKNRNLFCEQLQNKYYVEFLKINSFLLFNPWHNKLVDIQIPLDYSKIFALEKTAYLVKGAPSVYFSDHYAPLLRKFISQANDFITFLMKNFGNETLLLNCIETNLFDFFFNKKRFN